MNTSLFVFILSVGCLFTWMGTALWLRKGGRRMPVALGACFQTAFQVSLVLGVFSASVESFSSRTGTRPLLDFAPLYVGGKLFLHDPGRLYDAEAQLTLESASTGLELQADDFLPFPYPPFVAAGLSIPTVLDFASSYRLFLLLNLASLLATVYLLVRRLQLDSPRSQVLVLLITAFFPVYITLKQGQFSLIFGLLHALFWLHLMNGTSRPGFFWAGLLTGKPSLLPGPMATLLSRRRWRSLVQIAAASLLLWGLPLLRTGPATLFDYGRLLRDMGSGRFPTVSLEPMCGLRGLDFWLGGANWIWVSGSLLLLAALWLTRRWRLNGWGCSTLILLTLLLAPHLYLHDLVLVLPALALVLKELPVVRGGRFYLLFLLSLLPLLTVSIGATVGLSLPWLALPLLACLGGSLLQWKRSL